MGAIICAPQKKKNISPTQYPLLRTQQTTQTDDNNDQLRFYVMEESNPSQVNIENFELVDFISAPVPFVIPASFTFAMGGPPGGSASSPRPPPSPSSSPPETIPQTMDKKKVKRIPSRPPEKFTYTLVKSPSSTTDWNHRYPDCRGCGAASLKAQKSVVPRGGSRRAAVDRGFVKAGYTAYFHPTQKKWYVWNDRSRLLETKKKAEKNHDRNHRVVVDPGDSIMGFDYGVTNFDFPDSDHSEESEGECSKIFSIINIHFTNPT